MRVYKRNRTTSVIYLIVGMVLGGVICFDGIIEGVEFLLAVLSLWFSVFGFWALRYPVAALQGTFLTVRTGLFSKLTIELRWVDEVIYLRNNELIYFKRNRESLRVNLKLFCKEERDQFVFDLKHVRAPMRN